MTSRGQEQKSDWLSFYRASSKSKPMDTLTRALSLFDAEPSQRRQRFAIDLGCGAGRDTLELLRRGWRVLAVDNQPEAISWLRSAVSPEFRGRLQTRLASFEKIRLPHCDLVNASYSLPFCSPKFFNPFWGRIVFSIRSGGRFSGHFFGIHDEWARTTHLTFHSAKQVKALLRDLKVEYFVEKEWRGRTASRRKYWHVFSVVARKI
jgi:SAM-dependent methyltransferase